MIVQIQQKCCFDKTLRTYAILRSKKNCQYLANNAFDFRDINVIRRAVSLKYLFRSHKNRDINLPIFIDQDSDNFKTPCVKF